MILSGNPFNDPYKMGLISNNYLEGTCSDEKFLMNTSTIGSIQSENTIDKTYDVLVNNVFLVASEFFISQLTCETPIKPMTQYKVEEVKCVDASGEDPWASAKAIVGNIVTFNMTFTETTLLVQHDSQLISLKRFSEDGCSNPTEPPSPTTVPPTPENGKLWMWLWISSGIIIVVIIIIVIAQQYKRKADSKSCASTKPLI